MISSVLFMESLILASSVSRNIPSVKTGLPYILKRMTDQPNQEATTGQFIQTQSQYMNMPQTQVHGSRQYVTRREPMKSTTTTIKKKYHMHSDRVSYTTSSRGQTSTKETLAVEAPSVGGGWGIEWCGLIEIVADAYFSHGPDNSEKSYVDKTFYKLYDLGIPAIRERAMY